MYVGLSCIEGFCMVVSMLASRTVNMSMVTMIIMWMVVMVVIFDVGFFTFD